MKTILQPTVRCSHIHCMEHKTDRLRDQSRGRDVVVSDLTRMSYPPWMAQVRSLVRRACEPEQAGVIILSSLLGLRAAWDDWEDVSNPEQHKDVVKMCADLFRSALNIEYNRVSIRTVLHVLQCV